MLANLVGFAEALQFGVLSKLKGGRCPSERLGKVGLGVVNGKAPRRVKVYGREFGLIATFVIPALSRDRPRRLRLLRSQIAAAPLPG